MNSAQRIQNILVQFRLNPTNAQSAGWQTWLTSINMEPSDDNVLRAVQATTREIRALQAGLKQIGVPESLYEPVCKNMLAALHSNQLHQSWGNVMHLLIAAEVTTTLNWMAWALTRLDEPDIDAESYEALQQAIAEQEQLLTSADLPHNLRELLAGQIDEMKVALMLYQVNGIKPVVDAVNKQYGEMNNVSPDLVQEMKDAGPDAEKAVSGGISVLAKAAKFAESGSKLYKFGKDLHELATNGWQLLERVLPPGSGS